jgi:hypothetical protein
MTFCFSPPFNYGVHSSNFIIVVAVVWMDVDGEVHALKIEMGPKRANFPEINHSEHVRASAETSILLPLSRSLAHLTFFHSIDLR